MPISEIRLDRKSRVPLYLQIKNQIKDMILKDLLPEGKRLLPTREMAHMLEVNRSTIVSAYNELIDDGYIESHVGRGTIIRKKGSPDNNSFSRQPMNWAEFFTVLPKIEQLSFYEDYISLSPQEDIISLGIGIPDPDYYPSLKLKDILDKIIKDKPKIILQLSPSEGCYPLQEALANWIPHDDTPINPDEVFITSGAVQALYILCQALLAPGDLVVVESPTSMNSLRTFRAAQAKIIDIPVDNQGMRVDILDNLLSRQKVKLIYTVPTFQNPSGTVLSLERRVKLLDLARKYLVPIIEEDPYSKLYFDRIPPPSLKAMDTFNSVIHIGTFSKILFQGLRVGWIVAPKPVIKQIIPIKSLIDLHTSTLEQYVFSEFINQGLLEKHLQKMRKVYARKRDLLVSALSKCCPDELKWNTPEGGICLWCQLTQGLNAVELLRESIYEKVIFIEGKLFSPQGNHDDWLRLNFTYLNENQIEEGIRRLNRSIQKLKKRHITKTDKESLSFKPVI